MKALDIQKGQSIVCYDCSPNGIFSSARAAFMLRNYGATDVRILNGGMKKWQAEGRETVSGPVESPPSEQSDGDYSFALVDSPAVIKDIAVVHEFAA